ncbi:hypothetical protein LKD70_03115 [Ruminococcus sp. CLA-AA-H200]|uniref:Uncharacterized protein n=1 Tax=Ruminococcus turbiniformis TaxID=2881258 RepID=A0ABS8FTQ6_9FIRM|nr:hypothetical protein [Ruminococcus turbiniformis]MCC2253436.1 hypothetical protein [Ruminococcus turbiniformis]
MEERSILWCIFHHPLKIIIRTGIFWIVLYAVIYILGALSSDADMSFLSTDLYRYGSLVLCFILALLNVKKTTNDELIRAQAYQNVMNKYQTNTQTASAPTGKKKKKKSLLFGAMKSMNNSMNSNLEGFANGVGNAFMGSSGSNNTSYQERQKKANQDAWNRWHAQDMQKKAEWDARDAALRGKDRAAQQRRNDADYWRNQSKR